ncbi:MAG: hypothetical protein WDZ52_04460 [Pseudohongiellaceae bacterium]
MKHLTLMTLLLAGLALTACDNNGSAENLGEDIDRAASDAGNAIEELCEDITDDNCD